MKTIHHILSYIIIATILSFVMTSAIAVPADSYPSGSIAANTATAVVNMTNPTTRAAAIASVPGILTAIEALDNTTTIPRSQLDGIVVYLGSLRGISDAIATRIDQDIPLLKAIIKNHRDNKIP